jgi:hypothetical protein
MQAATEFITGLLREVWLILNETSPWVLLGFVVAALIRAFIPDSLVHKHLGGRGFMPVLKAALFGIPIPLCSCGVIPTAMSLKKQGAGSGATTSFLISTPETGVDSIAVTWALMDPLMTVFRPIAAFVTAIAAGLIENLFSSPPTTESNADPVPCACNGGCAQPAVVERKYSTLIEKLREGFDFTFGQFLSEIGRWLLIGIVIAGAISYFVPDDYIAVHLGNSVLQMIVMLIIGLPMYVCASSSTPVAAALVLKGLSPGAALVFLLAGPATNAATMTVIAKMMGRRSLVIYLVSIAVFSIGLGLLLDQLYVTLGVSLVPRIAEAEAEKIGLMRIGSSIVLLLLIARSVFLCSRNDSPRTGK